MEHELFDCLKRERVKMSEISIGDIVRTPNKKIMFVVDIDSPVVLLPRDRVTLTGHESLKLTMEHTDILERVERSCLLFFDPRNRKR